MTHRTRTDESGSLLVAMLITLMVASLVATVFAYVVYGNRSTTNDRDFQISVTGAEAGIQEALTIITNANGALPSPQTGSGTINGVDYTWTATDSGLGDWEVVSTGTEGQRSRTLEAAIVRETTFRLGAFADVAFQMRGANSVRSYSSGTGATDTGSGSAGSNGEVDFVGNGYADFVYLFGEAVCDRRACEMDMVSIPDPFDIPALVTQIQTDMDAACPDPGDFSAWSASSGATLTGGQTYCFSSMDFDQDVVLSGASAADPVIAYVSGNVSVDNGTEINCSGCNANSTPVSAALQIYTLGDEFLIGNQGAAAWAVAAPNASCQGNPSNAQADIFGSMICGDLSNQGGWSFFFDVDLLDLNDADYDIEALREEIP